MTLTCGPLYGRPATARDRAPLPPALTLSLSLSLSLALARTWEHAHTRARTRAHARAHARTHGRRSGCGGPQRRGPVCAAGFRRAGGRGGRGGRRRRRPDFPCAPGLADFRRNIFPPEFFSAGFFPSEIFRRIFAGRRRRAGDADGGGSG